MSVLLDSSGRHMGLILSALALPVAGSACGDPEQVGVTSTRDDAKPTGDAAGEGGTGGVDGRVPEGDAGCRVVEARRYDSQLGCLGPLEYAGCADARSGCTEWPVPARSSDGACWRLPHTCVPGGFTPATHDDECTTQAHAAECTNPALSGQPQSCQDGTVLIGRYYDAEARCRGPSHVVGCLAAGTGCNELTTRARASDGSCWEFGNGGACTAGLVEDRTCPYGQHCEWIYQGEDCAGTTLLEARQYDPTRGCLGPLVAVGCYDATCTERPVGVRRSDATCWSFPTDCFPTGFTESASDDDCTRVPNAPLCSP
jgi:hypothetical protein